MCAYVCVCMCVCVCVCVCMCVCVCVCRLHPEKVMRAAQFVADRVNGLWLGRLRPGTAEHKKEEEVAGATRQLSRSRSVSVSDGRFSLTMFGIVAVAKLVWVAVASSVTRFGKKVFGQFSMLNKYVAKFRTCLGKFSLLQLAK